MKSRFFGILMLAILVMPWSAHGKDLTVVVSIKPLHALVSGMMEGVAETVLIVDGAASPHTFNLKPSHAAALQTADLIVWIGPSLEAFMVKPIDTLGPKATVLEISDVAGLTLYPYRKAGPLEAHDDGHADEHGHGDDHKDDHADAHGHDHGHGDHEGIDPHLWLDPANAKIIVNAVAKTLITLAPHHTDQFKANAAKTLQRIDGLTHDMKATLAPVKDRPFIVFHDAYQYLEKRFDLHTAGSITVSPEQMPGAKRLREIQEIVEHNNVRCIFAEPQFDPRLIEAIAANTDAKGGILDPLGSAIASGPDHYFEWMRAMAVTIRECLSD